MIELPKTCALCRRRVFPNDPFYEADCGECFCEDCIVVHVPTCDACSEDIELEELEEKNDRQSIDTTQQA